MIKGLNDVIDYIEDHLTDVITLDDLAQLSGMSDIQLRKVFYFLSGLTLNEYIKRRRFTCATQDILNGGSITEAAYTYCYDSLDGFTRAYKAWSGYLPSDIKKEHIITTSPKLTFTIHVEGGNTMQYRIIDLPAFTLAGVSKRVQLQYEGVNSEIVALAQSITEKQRHEIHRIKNMEPMQILNVSWDSDSKFMEESGYLTHMIGVATTVDDVDSMLDVKAVDAHTWVVFTCDGPFPETMQQCMADIYAKWLPSSDYQLVDAPTFSYTIDSKREANFKFSEIYVAVKKL